MVSTPRVIEHLTTAKEKPIPVNTGKQFVEGDNASIGYIGVALQVHFKWHVNTDEMFWILKLMTLGVTS